MATLYSKVSILLVVIIGIAGSNMVSAMQKIRVIKEFGTPSIRIAEEEKPAIVSVSREDIDVKLLKQKGIEPDFAGIKKYLNDIHITEEQKKEAASLIQLLGSEDYQIRQDATKKLSHFPGLPIEEFEQAKKDSDAETVYRIEMVARFLNVSFGKTLGRSLPRDCRQGNYRSYAGDHSLQALYLG